MGCDGSSATLQMQTFTCAKTSYVIPIFNKKVYILHVPG